VRQAALDHGRQAAHRESEEGAEGRLGGAEAEEERQEEMTSPELAREYDREPARAARQDRRPTRRDCGFGTGRAARSARSLTTSRPGAAYIADLEAAGWEQIGAAKFSQVFGKPETSTVVRVSRATGSRLATLRRAVPGRAARPTERPVDRRSRARRRLDHQHDQGARASEARYRRLEAVRARAGAGAVLGRSVRWPAASSSAFAQRASPWISSVPGGRPDSCR
jgi:hypothetical protein